MNKITKYGPMLIMLLLASTVILLKGCGGNPDGAKLAGCPSGSLLANTGDLFTIFPADAKRSGYVFTGSITTTLGVAVAPLSYQVTDKNGVPRNKICVKFYTDGFFWERESWYSVIAPNPLTLVTDESGMVTVYWSTAPILVSIPATSGVGADQTFQSFINAYSGPVLDLYTDDVTVLGCPDGTLGTCP